MYIWHPNDSFNKIINKGLISPQFLPVIYQSLISVIIWVNIPRVAATVGGFLQSSLSKLMLAMGWYWKKTKCPETNLGSFFPGSDFHRSSIFNVYTLRRKWQETLLKIGTWIQPRPARSAVDPPLILTMTRSSMLPVALLALGAWMLSSLTSQSGFVMNSATPRGSKVAMRGFKDDFYAWKETLSSEDQALLLKQAQNASWHKGVTMEGGFNETHVLCSCLFPWHVFFLALASWQVWI